MSRFKMILIHPLIVALVCAAEIAIAKGFGFEPHLREMMLAILITLAAAELAMFPQFMVQNKPADVVVQGAMASMVIHLLVATAGGLIVLQGMHPSHSFVYWLCPLYWATLAGVCRVLLRAVKSAQLPVTGTAQVSEV